MSNQHFSFVGKPNQACKTQSSVYDRLLMGDELTDRVIEKYQLKGRYGTEMKKQAEMRVKERQEKVKGSKEKRVDKKRAKKHLDDLVDGLI